MCKTASSFFLSYSDSRLLERDNFVVVVRLAAVFFSYRAFLYQAYAAQLLDGLNHRRALQTERGANVVIAVPEPFCCTVGALAEEQIHSRLCRCQHIFEQTAADKEKIPS